MLKRLPDIKYENEQLKKNKIQLEQDVKTIATQLKRRITDLKRDRIVGKGGALADKLNLDVDTLIEENVRLQDMEQKLIKQVKAIQAKRKKELKTNEKKVLRSTLDREASPPKLDHVKRVKLQVEQSSEAIRDLKMKIENARKHSVTSQHDHHEHIRKFQQDVREKDIQLT